MREEHICNTKHANNFVHAKWKQIISKVINFAKILGDIWKHFPGGDEQILVLELWFFYFVYQCQQMHEKKFLCSILRNFMIKQ